MPSRSEQHVLLVRSNAHARVRHTSTRRLILSEGPSWQNRCQRRAKLSRQHASEDQSRGRRVRSTRRRLRDRETKGWCCAGRPTVLRWRRQRHRPWCSARRRTKRGDATVQRRYEQQLHPCEQRPNAHASKSYPPERLPPEQRPPERLLPEQQPPEELSPGWGPGACRAARSNTCCSLGATPMRCDARCPSSYCSVRRGRCSGCTRRGCQGGVPEHAELLGATRVARSEQHPCGATPVARLPWGVRARSCAERVPGADLVVGADEGRGHPGLFARVGSRSMPSRSEQHACCSLGAIPMRCATPFDSTLDHVRRTTFGANARL